MVIETLPPFDAMNRVFCIRAMHGEYAEAFVRGGYVGLDWLKGYDLSEADKDSIRISLEQVGDTKVGDSTIQIDRFMREIRNGDWVLTPGIDQNRIYVGKVASDYFYQETEGDPCDHRRSVDWQVEPVRREALPQAWRLQMRNQRAVFRVDSADDDEIRPQDGMSMPTVNERPYWFVGAAYGGKDDQTDQFIEDGIWRVNFKPGHRYTDKINSMQPGDRIAIKAFFTQEHNLPFEARPGRMYSGMHIKAIGTITENPMNGQSVGVDWTRVDPVRDWYFYTNGSTVWEVRRGHGAWPWAADQLIRFAFDGAEQDYPPFLKAWGIGGEGEGEEEEDGEEAYEPTPSRDLDTLARNLYFPDASRLLDIELLLEEKKQVIFYGPPGTGKTYVARELAKHLAGDMKRVTFVQFHPSYAYEDFVQGYRPVETNGQISYELTPGPLLRAAKRAEEEEDADHFLVIDEINRGNLAKVFGELYFLLEYRDEELRLQYSREEDGLFSLPTNLYIIGTMNTADRSIALVDLALRRRFYFVEFHPDEPPVKGLLARFLEGNDLREMQWVASFVDEANKELDDHEAAIGPSHFMNPDLDEDMARRVWKHAIRPYIEERLQDERDERRRDRLKKFDDLWERRGDASPTEPADAPPPDGGDEEEAAASQ